MKRLHIGAALAALVLVMAACGDDGVVDAPTTDSDGPAVTEAPETDQPSDDDGDDALGGARGVELTISGGTLAGVYSDSASDVFCFYTEGELGTFGFEYVSSGDDALSGVSLLVNNPAAAAAGGTDEFGLSIYSNDVEVEPLTIGLGFGGTGTVTLDDRGDDATVTIQGQTADGVGIDLTVECQLGAFGG